MSTDIVKFFIKIKNRNGLLRAKINLNNKPNQYQDIRYMSSLYQTLWFCL